MPAASIRARVRAEMIEEITQVARRHLASDGATLSLRAVARDVGMVSSAVYRYFPSRDALLLALVTESDEALAEAVADADAGVRRDRYRARWTAVSAATREWAIGHSADWGLLFGG